MAAPPQPRRRTGRGCSWLSGPGTLASGPRWQRRALAATLLQNTGLAVRVVVVYAPVGACSPGFAHSSLAPAEADLKLFVDAQISLCAANSMALIIGGDLNSFAPSLLWT